MNSNEGKSSEATSVEVASSEARYRAAVDSPLGVMFMWFDAKRGHGVIVTERIVEAFAGLHHFEPSECELVLVEDTENHTIIWSATGLTTEVEYGTTSVGDQADAPKDSEPGGRGA